MKDKFEMNIDIALPDIRRAKRAVKKAVKSVKYDVAAFRDRDPAASSDLEVLLLYSGLHARAQGQRACRQPGREISHRH